MKPIWKGRQDRRRNTDQAPLRHSDPVGSKTYLSTQARSEGISVMAIVTATDGTNLFYKDWGPKDAQPVM
ncbi:MAG: hypothetical protein Q8L92_15480, partial [Rubrivivax sp.]|nr:hypothetical protein [Rubrivivax sp.]